VENMSEIGDNIGAPRRSLRTGRGGRGRGWCGVGRANAFMIEGDA
jgi:hypothetical protein